MNSIFFLSSLTFIIAVIMTLLIFILSKKSLMDREKLSPFECGFDPVNKSRKPFSLRFFLITMIFLVFDVEIALLLPLGILMYSLNPITLTLASAFICIILILGLLHEWNQGALNWIQ